MTRLTKNRFWLLAIGCWLLAFGGSSCTDRPESPTLVKELPSIYPDYIGVTIPVNIAPLDFNASDEAIECMDVVVKGSKGGELHANGAWADFDIDDWHSLTEQNAGGELTFTVCMKKDLRDVTIKEER